jgi:plastocyanin
MAFPRILFVVPLLVAGIFVPAAITPKTPPPGAAVTMEHEMFVQHSVTIHRGQRLTLVNNSLFVHIIGPGRDGRLFQGPPGEAITARVLMQTNETFTTAPWNTPGTYWVTCSVHPEMTVKVIVTN